MAKHIHRAKNYEGNILSISLAFKKKIKFANNDKHYTILMGDFNATVNPKIDRYNTNISKNNRSTKPESSISRYLNNNQLFYADIILAHLTSQSDRACAIIERETNIFEKQKPMLKTIECQQRIEFNYDIKL
ncbi:4543_t:CDS:2 [Diversispora eburnea]|uniref:4543_t:CDS:1 n=1 Tax=Diversispora eburnea TaxID=1213867 RepID=A0A9N8VTZ8_9GLOM|nr:4543_t:CDS:2 [Diversispora eburnea]